MRIYWNPEREEWVTEREMLVILNLTEYVPPVSHEDRVKAIHNLLYNNKKAMNGKNEQDGDDGVC